jgi:UDP-N-acetylmuramyl pentapeptide phosphotransferase/UDP-N-acetylglucosamine-1-phosphate transferase
MIRRLTSFARFWYDFFVGDDWTVAVGVVLALAATYLLSRTTVPVWWITPTAVVLLLAVSVARAGKRTK